MTSSRQKLRTAVPPPRRLGDLVGPFPLTVAGAGGPGWADVTVRGVRADNREIAGGELFAAHTGGHVHGARFARAAVDAGAAAVLTDPAGERLLAGDDPLGVPVLVADDVPALLGELAATLYDRPADRLGTFAVTGTNGKTTTVFMLEHALRALGRRTGLIGTVELRVGEHAVPATLTTPQPADLQALLATMVAEEVDDLVMEVSSHALALHRVDPVVFDVAGFTNLTQDHLDFHATLDEYFDAKAELFTPARSRRGVVLVDDDWGRRLAERSATVHPGAVVTLAVHDGTFEDPDWRVREVAADGTGTAFTLVHRDGRTLRTRTGLPGDFNVANAALAAAMVLESGVDPATLGDALAAAGGLSPQVPGRMEQLADAPRVIVDFAHNPGALDKALAALRPTTKGRLVLVFGATGSRDRSKRPEMARVAVDGADVVVVTDDDPHDEPAEQIRAEVLAAARVHVPDATVREIGSRSEAIRTVVLEAGEDDTVLVAGRGHETVQEIAGVDHHLDDREEVRAALVQRAGGHS
ncbi:UDP-N-acetylmuramoyl-L-alanyl-D-glutamate--2,6-diaminopimelate ligase [Georgenia soli]|uniref:UDP-N-acetylmuramoyl-L-alanyl-D-glutamate--2, 6-diaminopimelate ligase n=1 Tax=Georgenia soli TaxID=638953 RepID=UPI000BF52A00|nr:UDP-N-acetylmuramoyl-L-alanyl-D-glutamate--2,6-diaminopimelate ligase [Georgenia soli]